MVDQACSMAGATASSRAGMSAATLQEIDQKQGWGRYFFLVITFYQTNCTAEREVKTNFGDQSGLPQALSLHV